MASHSLMFLPGFLSPSSASSWLEPSCMEWCTLAQATFYLKWKIRRIYRCTEIKGLLSFPPVKRAKETQAEKIFKAGRNTSFGIINGRGECHPVFVWSMREGCNTIVSRTSLPWKLFPDFGFFLFLWILPWWGLFPNWCSYYWPLKKAYCSAKVGDFWGHGRCFIFRSSSSGHVVIPFLDSELPQLLHSCI